MTQSWAIDRVSRLRAVVLFLLTLLLAPPASAELRVRVSRSVTGRYEPVAVTASDPLGGIDAQPGPISLTMADAGDQRLTIFLEPTGRPGEWSGWFTPQRTGRFTGTAVLERKDGEREIGLVPLLRVRPSRKPGFLRLHPSSRRVLKFTQGGTLFPIGVRVEADDLRPGTEWRVEFDRLRRAGVNYVELPVTTTADDTTSAPNARLQLLDSLVTAAEQAGLFLQLRLQPSADGAESADQQVERWVRRWAYSPAVAVWRLAPANAEDTERLIGVVRNADAYRHLIAASGSTAPPGADLVVRPSNWQRPSNEFALFEATETSAGPAPLPGENSWQMLALGGVGLPLWPYQPGSAASAAQLQRIARLAEAARSIPYAARTLPLTGLAPVDTPASFCRYGPTVVGWLAAEQIGLLAVPGLARGRYRVHFWDPRSDARAGEQVVWSEGQSNTQIDPPEGLKSLFVQVEPTTGGRPPVKTAARPHVAAPAAVKPIKTTPAVRPPAKPSKPKPPAKVAKKPVKKPVKKPEKKTPAQLRAEKKAAKAKAVRETELARKKKAVAAREQKAKKRAQTKESRKKPGKEAAGKKAPKKTAAQLRAEKKKAVQAKKAAKAQNAAKAKKAAKKPRKRGR